MADCVLLTFYVQRPHDNSMPLPDNEHHLLFFLLLSFSMSVVVITVNEFCWIESPINKGPKQCFRIRMYAVTHPGKPKQNSIVKLERKKEQTSCKLCLPKVTYNQWRMLWTDNPYKVTTNFQQKSFDTFLTVCTSKSAASSKYHKLSVTRQDVFPEHFHISPTPYLCCAMNQEIMSKPKTVWKETQPKYHWCSKEQFVKTDETFLITSILGSTNQASVGNVRGQK